MMIFFLKVDRFFVTAPDLEILEKHFLKSRLFRNRELYREFMFFVDLEILEKNVKSEYR